MLTINPTKRITAQEALKHPWVCVSIIISSWQETRPLWLKPSNIDERLHCRCFLLYSRFRTLINWIVCSFFIHLAGSVPCHGCHGFFPETVTSGASASNRLSNGSCPHKAVTGRAAPLWCFIFSTSLFSVSPQQRSTVASMMHRQETVECLKKFNARRKLKVWKHQMCQRIFKSLELIMALKWFINTFTHL